MRRKFVRILLVVPLVLVLCHCGRAGVSQEFLNRYGKLFELSYNDAMTDEPLCVYAGPFPLETKNVYEDCRPCDALTKAGLLREAPFKSEHLTFYLTGKGEQIYTEEIDWDLVTKVKRRFESQESERVPNARELSKPRFCFGRKLFHHISEALPPFSVGGTTAISVKIISEARDLNPMLWDSQIANLGLPIPPKPESGKPAFYPPEIVTFTIMSDGNSVAIDDMRYGKWINEK